MNRDALIEKAKKVLEDNWTGSYTKLAPELYPHQWCWDSGFISIGYSHYNQQRAKAELISLFKGQWKNGMVPHIVYHYPSEDYFPDATDWNVGISNDSPEAVKTSGITQPPILATSALRIYMNAKDKRDALKFLKQVFPRLMSFHRFLYEFRDIEGRGLVANIHPWETGMDNSPKWDAILKSIEIESANTPLFERKDLSFVPPEERPSDEAYYKFIHLFELLKKHHYDQQKICKESPFLVYDVLFNSILHRANCDLLKIAGVLKEDTSEIERWIETGQKAFEEILWCDEDSMYHSYDLRRNESIEVYTASCALPLYAGIPNNHKALRIRDKLLTVCPFHEANICVSIPSYHTTWEGFSPLNYWRGPIWVNINWMILKGLLNYGFQDLARKICRNLMRLASEIGFWEYYDPFEMKGHGSNKFSWTAALLIDILNK